MSSREEKRRAVPKFGSFKPRSAETPDDNLTIQSSKARAEKNQDQPHGKQSERQKKDRQRSPSHRSHRSPARKAGEPVEEESSSRDARSNLFFLDKRGDPLILRYGGNDRARVPNYRRSGAGKVMGSEGILEVRGIGSREEFVIRGFQSRDSHFREKQSALARAARLTRSWRIKQSTGVQLPDGTEDFLPLRSGKRTRDGLPSSPVVQEEPDFRSVEIKAKDYEGTTSDESEGDSSEQEMEVEMTETKIRSIELSRRVKDHPDDTESWIALLGIQEDLFRQSKDGNYRTTQDEVKALAEVKIAMYEKALSHANLSTERARLLTGLMREGAKVWSPEVLSKRWNEITETCGLEFAVWKERLSFELTNMADFSQEAVTRFFLQKLSGLKIALTDQSLEEKLACEQIVHVFLLLTRFLHRTGYIELAAAAWQGILEMTFARPAGESVESAFPSFAEFWESEVPRFGEDGAKGWAHYKSQGKADVPMPEPATFEPTRFRDTGDYLKAWDSAERLSAASARLPARTMDEGVDNDPFRVVVISDIEEFLVWFPSALVPHVQFLLADAFLIFCELPPALTTDQFAESSVDDPFLSVRSATFEAELCRQHQEPADAADMAKRMPHFRQQGTRVAISPDVLFSGPNWFRYLSRWSEPDHAKADRVDWAWATRALRFLVLELGLERLAEYYLAMEWTKESSTARKTAKQLLKRYPENLRLYNAYASIEFSNGHTEISEKVFSSATSQSPITDSPDAQLLWNNWSWMELEAGRKRTALARLCSSVDPQRASLDISPGLLLKVRSHFTSCRDYSLSSENLEYALHHEQALILLDYLSANNPEEAMSHSQGNISAAMTNVRTFSEELHTRNLIRDVRHERLLQFAAKLLHYHATHGPFRPNYVREQVRDFVHRFPRNTIFLSLLSWSETGVRIDDPVRTTLRDLCLSPANDCITNRAFAIQYELENGTLHGARAAFEAAVASDACRGNAFLWICYVRFCFRRKELRSKAKEVFYRAAAVCPWSKDLYMEAFGTLIKDMSSAELRAVFNTMVAKGIRVHVDLDQFTAPSPRSFRSEVRAQDHDRSVDEDQTGIVN